VKAEIGKRERLWWPCSSEILARSLRNRWPRMMSGRAVGLVCAGVIFVDTAGVQGGSWLSALAGLRCPFPVQSRGGR
jgi:hypothetical protein